MMTNEDSVDLYSDLFEGTTSSELHLSQIAQTGSVTVDHAVSTPVNDGSTREDSFVASVTKHGGYSLQTALRALAEAESESNGELIEGESGGQAKADLMEDVYSLHTERDIQHGKELQAKQAEVEELKKACDTLANENKQLRHNMALLLATAKKEITNQKAMVLTLRKQLISQPPPPRYLQPPQQPWPAHAVTYSHPPPVARHDNISVADRRELAGGHSFSNEREYDSRSIPNHHAKRHGCPQPPDRGESFPSQRQKPTTTDNKHGRSEGSGNTESSCNRWDHGETTRQHLQKSSRKRSRASFVDEERRKRRLVEKTNVVAQNGGDAEPSHLKVTLLNELGSKADSSPAESKIDNLGEGREVTTDATAVKDSTSTSDISNLRAGAVKTPPSPCREISADSDAGCQQLQDPSVQLVLSVTGQTLSLNGLAGWKIPKKAKLTQLSGHVNVPQKPLTTETTNGLKRSAGTSSCEQSIASELNESSVNCVTGSHETECEEITPSHLSAESKQTGACRLSTSIPLEAGHHHVVDPRDKEKPSMNTSHLSLVQWRSESLFGSGDLNRCLEIISRCNSQESCLSDLEEGGDTCRLGPIDNEVNLSHVRENVSHIEDSPPHAKDSSSCAKDDFSMTGAVFSMRKVIFSHAKDGSSYAKDSSSHANTHAKDSSSRAKDGICYAKDSSSHVRDSSAPPTITAVMDSAAGCKDVSELVDEMMEIHGQIDPIDKETPTLTDPITSVLDVCQVSTGKRFRIPKKNSTDDVTDAKERNGEGETALLSFPISNPYDIPPRPKAQLDSNVTSSMGSKGGSTTAQLAACTVESNTSEGNSCSTSINRLEDCKREPRAEGHRRKPNGNLHVDYLPADVRYNSRRDKTSRGDDSADLSRRRLSRSDSSSRRQRLTNELPQSMSRPRADNSSEDLGHKRLTNSSARVQPLTEVSVNNHGSKANHLPCRRPARPRSRRSADRSVTRASPVRRDKVSPLIRPTERDRSQDKSRRTTDANRSANKQTRGSHNHEDAKSHFRQPSKRSSRSRDLLNSTSRSRLSHSDNRKSVKDNPRLLTMSSDGRVSKSTVRSDVKGERLTDVGRRDAVDVSRSLSCAGDTNRQSSPPQPPLPKDVQDVQRMAAGDAVVQFSRPCNADIPAESDSMGKVLEDGEILSSDDEPSVSPTLTPAHSAVGASATSGNRETASHHKSKQLSKARKVKDRKERHRRVDSLITSRSKQH